MTSLAAVMSNPDSRGTPPWPLPPRPMTIFLRARSFISSARFQRTERGSSGVSSKWSRLSIAAASRLWAAVIAWKSPVNWRLIWSEGSRPAGAAARRALPGRRPGPSTAAGAASTDRSPILREPLGQARFDTRRLPLAGRRGRDRRDEDQLAGFPTVAVQGFEVDLGLVAAVRLQVILGDAQVAGDFGDRSQHGSTRVPGAVTSDTSPATHASHATRRSDWRAWRSSALRRGTRRSGWGPLAAEGP